MSLDAWAILRLPKLQIRLHAYQVLANWLPNVLEDVYEHAKENKLKSH